MLSFPRETCTILLAHHSSDRLVIAERHPAPEWAYNARESHHAELKPEFLVPLVKRARDNSLSVVFCHTHPSDARVPQFSSVDDAGERHLSEFLAKRVPDAPHAAIVISPGGAAARLLGKNLPVSIIEVGSVVTTIGHAEIGSDRAPQWDRQVRAFGFEGQAALRSAHVCVVGCGGTGSLVVQQLAHLGVRNITLIDPDTIEVTNLNRVVGADKNDVGAAKVDVAADMVRKIGFDTNVEVHIGDVRDQASAELLTTADAIFSCTDSHSSRAIINQIAYQYFIPTFDVGVAIQAEGGKVKRIVGRAQMLAPGLGCLVCGNILDWAEVRRELQSDEERALDRYIVGHNEPQPAVISLNSTVSSLAVTMFMAAFAGVPANARLQFYDGVDGRIRSASIKPSPTCVVCSAAGAFGKAGSWPIPTRAIP